MHKNNETQLKQILSKLVTKQKQHLAKLENRMSVDRAPAAHQAEPSFLSKLFGSSPPPREEVTESPTKPVLIR